MDIALNGRVLPTTIKCHMVKIVITWSIRPDENNNIGLGYSPSNEGHVSILTNSMLRTYTSDIDERIILR